MNPKKGQITFFVILGLVIVVIIVMTVYLFIAAQPKPEQVPFEYGNIESFITECLDNALISGVSYCSGNKCPNYKEELGGQVVTAFLGCVGTEGENIKEQFPFYEIEIGDVDINIMRSAERVIANLFFPVYIKKGEKEHKLDTFQSEYILEAEGCIPCPNCDENCILQGTEDLKVTILELTITFYPGEFVGLIAGDCLAC